MLNQCSCIQTSNQSALNMHSYTCVRKFFLNFTTCVKKPKNTTLL